MNGYLCFYGQDTCEVRAKTTLDAQKLALDIFAMTNPRKRIKGFEVSVILAEKGDQPVIHTPSN
jgi:hypothetical protein